jgi:hypothetical protein
VGEEGGADPRPPGSARAIDGDARFGGAGVRTRGWRPEVPGRGHGGSEDGGGGGGRAGGGEDGEEPGQVDLRMLEAPGRAVGTMAGVAGVDGAQAEPCAIYRCGRLR